MQQVVGALIRAVVDALAQRRGAGGEFGNGKVFHKKINVDVNDDDNFFLPLWHYGKEFAKF